jgi:glycosyltransferase involved in cell wall biosynthesis
MSASSLKVLMQIRPDYMRKLGGDSVQATNTQEYLRKNGVQVSLSTDVGEELSEYDIIHLFNVTRVDETFKYLKHAVQHEKPIVFSTIYWNADEYHAKRDSFFDVSAGTKQARKLKDSKKCLGHLKKKTALLLSDVLLPNSNAEREILIRDFGLQDKEFLIVPNAVAPSFEDASRDQFIQKYGVSDFVLCAARIEFRKNQLNLIKAVSGLNLRLVLIGDCFEPEYLAECKRAAGSNVIFIDYLPQSELASAYKAAKVHALPSWFETPGLASLEAALAGCNIVSTDRGSAKEYFGDTAWYCNPDDTGSIRQAVLVAFQCERKIYLKDRISQNFTWEVAAEKTLQAYQTAIARNHRRRPSNVIAELMDYVEKSEELLREFEQYAYELAQFRNRLTFAPLRLWLRRWLR